MTFWRSHSAIILTIAIVGAFYGIWLFAQRPIDQPERFAQIGDHFLEQGRGHSTTIDELGTVASPGLGYDGQFFVFMAVDLSHAPSYLDKPRYRMNRIGFPATATVISGGQRSLIPWTMLGIELLSVLAATGLLAVMVTAGGGSAFLALLYGLSPGLFLAASRFLSEAPANALAMLGVFLWLRRQEGSRHRRSIAGAGCAFAAAALTRETTLLFPLGMALWMISTGDAGFWSRARPAAALVGLAVTPLLCWQAFLTWWLPPEPVPDALHFAFVPFGGLIARGATAATVGQVLVVVIPSCIAVAITAISTRWSVWTAVIALNAVVLVVFLPPRSYDDLNASGRISLAIILAFIFAIPRVRGRLGAYGVATVILLWMLPWLYLFPRNFL